MPNDVSELVYNGIDNKLQVSISKCWTQ